MLEIMHHASNDAIECLWCYCFVARGEPGRAPFWRAFDLDKLGSRQAVAMEDGGLDKFGHWWIWWKGIWGG